MDWAKLIESLAAEELNQTCFVDGSNRTDPKEEDVTMQQIIMDVRTVFIFVFMNVSIKDFA